MSNKLKNIKALQQMLQGTHRTQTRKTFGFSDTKSSEERNRKRSVGEVWEEKLADGNSIWWEQKDSYRIKYHVHPDVSAEMQKIRDYLKTFPNCQKDICTCNDPSRLDMKFKKMVGMCEDCLISMETKLKLQGKFNEYAMNKMKKNAEDFFKQADLEVEVLKREVLNMKVVGDEHGNPIETWNFQDPDGYIRFIDDQYNKFKEKTLEKFNDKETIA